MSSLPRPRTEVRFRPMVVGDVEVVAAIEGEAFTCPWAPETFRSLLRHGQGEMWVVEGPGGEVLGYAVFWSVLDQGELANIAVRPDRRGEGLGSLLLERILEVARERGVRSLFLEVRESNRVAAGMYERRGFREVGRRKAYYRKPREDARILMRQIQP